MTPTSAGGPNMYKNTGKHTRPLNKPKIVVATNIRKYDLQSNNLKNHVKFFVSMEILFSIIYLDT